MCLWQQFELPANRLCGHGNGPSEFPLRGPCGCTLELPCGVPPLVRAEAVRVCGPGMPVADDASPAAYESLVGGTMVLAGV
jgi:hypothetical protein